MTNAPTTGTPDPARERAGTVLDDLKASSLIAAALASALCDERVSTPAEALGIDATRAAVLRTLPDAEELLGALWNDRRARGHNLISSLGQAAAAAAGTTRVWSDLSDEAVIAQGRSSALMARKLLTEVGPAFGLFAEGSPPRILDVGTGIGAIATALAEALPAAEIVGIDIAERPLAIARALLRDLDPAVAERVHLRLADVTDLADEAVYDIVWMPVPFLPDGIVDRALDRATAALRPGGLLVLGTNPDLHHEHLRVTSAWIASLTGGGTLTTSDLEPALARRGYRAITRFATVPGGPTLLAAVRRRER